MTVFPVQELTTREILYGARETSFRYELLTHDPATGIDSLAGYLDGVEPGGVLRWSAYAAVKKRGQLSIRDLDVAEAGKKRFRDINLYTTRIRPVMVIDGLPEIPLSVYLITKNPNRWSATGRTIDVSLLDKCTVLAEDAFEYTFTAETGTPVLEIVKEIVESAGETIAVDGSDTTTLATPSVFEPGVKKLTIINELLTESLNYNSLWVDGVGAFRATPYVDPADRSSRYSVLNDDDGQALIRELVDGDEAIYSPEWLGDLDTYGVPNKVIALSSGSGDEAPLVGVATNENPDSPFSYDARGRWVTPDEPLRVSVPDFSAEGDPDAATEAYLEAVALRSLIARTAIQSTVQVETLPLPVELLDAFRFASTPAGVDGRHTVQGADWRLSFDARLALRFEEVVSL